MTKRHDEAFAAVRNCVARDKVRCLHNDAGQFDYFTTPGGAAILAGVGIRTLHTRHPVDEQGHQFDGYVRQVVMEGRGGLMQKFGTTDRVNAAFSGVKLVPYTDEVVAEDIADREEVARRFADAYATRNENGKLPTPRGRGGFSR